MRHWEIDDCCCRRRRWRCWRLSVQLPRPPRQTLKMTASASLACTLGSFPGCNQRRRRRGRLIDAANKISCDWSWLPFDFRLDSSRLVSSRLSSSRLVFHVALRRIMSGLVLSFECQKLHMTAGVRLCYCGRNSIWLIALGLNEIQRVTIELVSGWNCGLKWVWIVETLFI